MVANCGTLNHYAASPMIMNMGWPGVDAVVDDAVLLRLGRCGDLAV